MNTKVGASIFLLTAAATSLLLWPSWRSGSASEAHSGDLASRPAAEPVLSDSNRNGVDDSVDIALGASVDRNFDGIPDECQPDLEASHVLLAHAGSWPVVTNEARTYLTSGASEQLLFGAGTVAGEVRDGGFSGGCAFPEPSIDSTGRARGVRCVGGPVESETPRGSEPNACRVRPSPGDPR